MNKNTTDITLSAYFNDIVIGYYEDEDLVKQFGRQLGFDVDMDTFMAVSFQYPSDMNVKPEDREKLTDAANAIIALSDINRKIRVGIGTIESGIKGIKHTYSNAQDAVKAGEIFKKDRVILEYMGMEIYSSINQMVVNFGDRLTRTVLKQLGETEKRVLAKYYKCKEDIAETARQLGMSEDDVKTSLNMVRINTGLDVNDTEDNFKLHFIMIARKVLENDERIKKNR